MEKNKIGNGFELTIQLQNWKFGLVTTSIFNENNITITSSKSCSTNNFLYSDQSNSNCRVETRLFEIAFWDNFLCERIFCVLQGYSTMQQFRSNFYSCILKIISILFNLPSHFAWTLTSTALNSPKFQVKFLMKKWRIAQLTQYTCPHCGVHIEKSFIFFFIYQHSLR